MLGRIFWAMILVNGLWGQAGAPPVAVPEVAAPPIQATVSEVIVPVTVTDSRGRFVSNLEKSDFRIYDEGKPQKITYFNRDRNQPVVVGFLMDLSNASRLHWKIFQDATLDLVNTLVPGDPKYSGYLIGYGNDAELLTNTHHDPEKMMDKIRKMKPGGGAALYDAIYMACTSRDLVKGEPFEPRRVIVIIGDGHDSASKHGFKEVLELAQRNLVTIYAISTVAYGMHSEGESNLEKLVTETGGRLEYPLSAVYKDVSGYNSTPMDEGNYVFKPGTGLYASATATAIFGGIGRIAGEVTTQYILRYSPETTDVGKLERNITVEVVDIPLLTVNARKRYYPFQP